MASFALTFKGSNHLKQKLILATISGKAVKITDIRIGEGIGIQEFEINTIRLIDKLTNGSHIKISASGTELEFTPGILHGGKIEHSCSVEKSIGKKILLNNDKIIKLFPFCRILSRHTYRIRSILQVPHRSKPERHYKQH